MRRSALVHSAWILAVAGKAGAATLYVDVTAPGCTDAATYAQAQDPNTPFCHIQPAANAVDAGDTVLVRGAVYPQSATLQINTGGTVATPVVFSSFGGSRAVIDGPALGSQAAVIIAADHVVLEQFEVRNASQDGIDVQGNDVTIAHNSIHDCGRTCDAGTSYCGRGINSPFGLSKMILDGNLAYRIGGGGNNDICFEIEPTQSVVTNNIAAQCTHGFVVYDGCSGCAVYNNLATQLSGQGFAVAGNGSSVNVGVQLYNNASVGDGIGVELEGNRDAGISIVSQQYFADGTNVDDPDTTTYAESGAVFGTALFVDAGAMDWHLSAGSAAIGSGSAALFAPLDFDGCPRGLDGAVDIGPFVYGGCSGDGGGGPSLNDGLPPSFLLVDCGCSGVADPGGVLLLCGLFSIARRRPSTLIEPFRAQASRSASTHASAR